MSKKLNPNFGHAVLKPVEDGEQLFGNIVMPDMGNEKGRLAIVEAIEPIYNFNLGTFVESKFKIGDTVLYPPMGGQRITIDREEYIVVSVTDLLASVE
jgi:chaperonin GroES